MSGIVGLINTDSAPVDRSLLQRMTDAMAYRGPDAQNVWINGHVGFGHTLLRTTQESAREQQPWSLDGQVWITADARVDDRVSLIQKLEARGRAGLNGIPDVELLLHAYHVWGEDCVEHLLGDFAFAIWDGPRQRLFCARDHFGVKPFYYAQVSKSLVFGNTLNCLRMHPAVSDELNDLAVADFLLFYFNQDPATTVFADVRRLPPAHHLIWSDGDVRVRRYWTLPADGHIRYRRAADYVAHFSELLQRSVADRLRTDHVGVLMSGGLDSSSIAAVAHRLLSKQATPFDLRAYTTVYDRLIPDEERYYSGLVAEALGIPIHYQVADDYELFERWDQPQITRQPEPINGPLAAASFDQSQEIASHSRVLLSGNGGDPVLYPSTSYFFYLLKKLQFGVAIKDVAAYFLAHGRLPQVGARTKLKGLLKRQPAPLELPAWLDQDFAARLDLQRRYEQLNKTPAAIHPTHPEAYRFLTTPYWPFLFETHEPGVTFAPVEARFPFFDLRLVNYFLSIPPLPWCLKKEILRAAMRGLLPEQVRLRPKAPLGGDPTLALFRRRDKHWLKMHLGSSSTLASYVNVTAALAMNRTEDSDEVWGLFRIVGFSKWLDNLAAQQDELALEEGHGSAEEGSHPKALQEP